MAEGGESKILFSLILLGAFFLIGLVASLMVALIVFFFDLGGWSILKVTCVISPLFFLLAGLGILVRKKWGRKIALALSLVMTVALGAAVVGTLSDTDGYCWRR